MGDVVGKMARLCLLKNLKSLKNEYQIDSVIVNVENSAAGFGVTKSIYHDFRIQDVDAMTTGNHVYDRREIIQEIDSLPKLIRPINLPQTQPGKGYLVFEVKGIKVMVMNAIGRVFMNPSDCPFYSLRNFLEEHEQDAVIKILDFHAETTSEKLAMGYALDGKVSCVFGTHTHVQTADEKILPAGTAYITDLGMVGAYHSVIGMKRQPIVEKFFDHMPRRFEPEDNGSILLNAIVLEIDAVSGQSLQIERVAKVYSEC